MLFFVMLLSFSVNAAGNLTMLVNSISPSAVLPGSTLNFNVNLTNTGNSGLNINITTTDPKDLNNNKLDVNDLLKDETLLGGETKTITLSYLVPAGVPGSYTATLTAVDKSNGTNIDSKTYGFTLLNPYILKLNGVDVSNSLSVDLESGESENQLTLSITNSGPGPITNLRAIGVFSKLEDNDNDVITITNPGIINSLAPGQSANILFNFDVDSGFDVSTVSGVLRLESNEISKVEVPFKLNVKPLACLPGAKSSDISLDVNNPDNNDNFAPGEDVNVDLDVENKGNDNIDIRLEALLYNVDSDKKIDSFSTTKNINDDDTKNFKFKMQLSDVKKDDVKLFIKVFDDDDDLRCKLEEVDLDLEVPDHEIKISNATLAPSIVNCGDRVIGTALLTNIGDNDEDVVFEAFSTQLGLSQSSQSFEINEDQDENDRTVSFGFNVPSNTRDGSYPISLRARYSGEESLAITQLSVQGCGGTTTQTLTTPQKIITSETTSSISTNSQQQPVFTGNTVFSEKSLFDNFNAKELGIPTSVWILINVLLVLLIIGCLVWLFRSR